MITMANVWLGNWRRKKKLEVMMIFENHNTVITLLLLHICGTSHLPGIKLFGKLGVILIFLHISLISLEKNNDLVYGKILCKVYLTVSLILLLRESCEEFISRLLYQLANVD